MEHLKVSDLMTREVVTIRPEDHLSAAYDIMSDRHIRHLPVVNDEGELEGLITHTDLVRSALFALNDLPLSEERRFLERTQVKEAMTHDPVTIDAEASLEEAARLLLDNKFGSLPVVENQAVVGIITEADFIKYVLENLEDNIDQSRFPQRAYV